MLKAESYDIYTNFIPSCPGLKEVSFGIRAWGLRLGAESINAVDDIRAGQVQAPLSLERLSRATSHIRPKTYARLCRKKAADVAGCVEYIRALARWLRREFMQLCKRVKVAVNDLW